MTLTKVAGKEVNKEAEAKALLIKERMDREKKCTDEINAILEKYQCVLQAQVILRDKEVSAGINLFSK